MLFGRQKAECSCWTNCLISVGYAFLMRQGQVVEPPAQLCWRLTTAIRENYVYSFATMLNVSGASTDAFSRSIKLAETGANECGFEPR